MRYHCIQCSDTGYHNLSIDNVTRPISMLKISRNLFCSITIRQKLSADQFPLDSISKLVKSHRSNEFAFFLVFLLSWRTKRSTQQYCDAIFFSLFSLVLLMSVPDIIYRQFSHKLCVWHRKDSPKCISSSYS